jgi:hypothetical protein
MEQIRQTIINSKMWLCALILSIFSAEVFAAWMGPGEIVSGAWGSGDTEFGIERGDTIAFDKIPNLIVTPQGRIVIRDGANKRLKIYSLTGVLESIIPYKAGLHYTELTLADSFGFTGEFIGYGLDGSIYCFRADQNKYLKYSSTGQLLNTYTERPLELGEVKEKYLGPGQYKVTVKFPDKTWEIKGKGAFPQYIRDLNGNLYALGDTQVARYDDQGNESARLTMPERKQEEMEIGLGVEPIISVIEEYGSPVVAPNGDVYTWKRTPDKYYIIKWTWQ